MAYKEARARIKINQRLEESGWRFFDSPAGPANVVLEQQVKLTPAALDDLGENFEKAKRGAVDFLLLDERGFPLLVLEAKAEHRDPRIGKEQARKYAASLGCRYVILSNGNLHYLWDLRLGNPELISRFPTQESLQGQVKIEPNPARLADEPVDNDYIALTQNPGYKNHAAWKNPAERDAFVEREKLRFLREYQLRAVHSIQAAVKQGSSRFLFEMATGTGKTLTAAAVIKLFLRSENARRVLFLVDRLELEDQAKKAFGELLKNDYTSVIYKQSRDDWRKADIVVTTVQSLLADNKFRRLFSPTDFDLLISDEAHRSIGGNSRAVFEYFTGYKLGLTATPKNYLKHFDRASADDPRELERRQLLDTYETFGCDNGQPTFSYTLLDGVRDGFLINPLVVDARTEITTQLLSKRGYAVAMPNTEGDTAEQSYFQRDFEKKFFSEATNRLFCQVFMDNALRDPVSGEFGKSIVYAVSQNHAAKLAQMFNELAHSHFPGRYQSDFAVQVTSSVSDAQQFTLQFAGNQLLGKSGWLEGYKTSKARVCVTVGMMTTGYDCPDLLNLGLMRPVFSPTEFIQIKGRGTRKHEFTAELRDLDLKQQLGKRPKTQYKLFDFFATCEYFEEEFNYDEILPLPPIGGKPDIPPLPPMPKGGQYEHGGGDILQEIKEEQIGAEGMKIDRMFFQRFADLVKAVPEIQQHMAADNVEQAGDYLLREIFDKPEEYFNLEKLSRAAGVDRLLSAREILEHIFGRIEKFKNKDELLDEEFDTFMLLCKPEDSAHLMAMKHFFKAYISSDSLRDIIDNKKIIELNSRMDLNTADFKAVPAEWRQRISQYVRENYELRG